MTIPITIDKLLKDNIVEWARIEFKEDWNPDTTLKTISAFANDIDNWGGGYIVIGIKEYKGTIARPIKGINPNSIDHIHKELLKYCKFLKPTYVPITQPVEYEDKLLLLIWVPGGYDRPYQCPSKPTSKNSEKKYYIRKLSSTIEATNKEVEELISLTNNIPFDDRVNIHSNITDLKSILIREYLSEIDSSLYATSSKKSVEDLAKDLRIASGPKEYFKPRNVGLLFFSERPELFFSYARIEVVNIPRPNGQGMEERIFTGPINQQLKDVLKFIKNNVIVEKVFKIKGQAESRRVFNYSYDALEEFISNAVYHKSYQIPEPITIRIESDKIEITSIPGPDRSISNDDIANFQMRSRRYRNRRIGDFLKELHLIEGRNTGIPTAIEAIKVNGSPMPILLTDDERSFFSVTMSIHPSFIENLNAPFQKKKRSREDIKKLILDILAQEACSLNMIYEKCGYSGSPSKVFREITKEMIQEKLIYYKEGENRNSSRTVLKLVDKR